MASPTETDPTGTTAPPARALLALVVIGTALVVIDMTIVTIGLPQIQADLHGTLAGTQWVIVAYMITMGAVTQVVGTLSDRLGRRRTYLTGVLVFTLASVVCGLAQDTLVLNLARAAQGVGGAILMTNAVPLLSHGYEGQRRNMAIATWTTMSTAASLVAPLLGGVLVDLLGWRAMFLVNVPFGVVAVALGLRALPADRPARGGLASLDWTGTALLVIALALANFALLRGEEQGWTSPSTLTQLGVAAALFVAFLVLQTRISAPTLDLSLFRVPAFTGAAFAIFMSRVLTIGGTVYFVQYFQNSLHLSPTASGLLLMPVFVAQMAAGMLGGKLQAWMPPAHVIAIGYACKGIGAAWMALAFSPGAQPWLLALPLLLWGTGGGVAGSPVFAVAMDAATKARAGMAAGTMTTLASVGAGVGTVILGVLYKSRLSSVVSADPALPTEQRTAITDAVAQGDVPKALDLVPAAAQETTRHVFEQAFAAAASSVLFTSAALAAVTMAAALVLIRKRNPREAELAKDAPAADSEAGTPSVH
ncbi:drug resistance transporter, EmrB/QacA subfamily [Streptoalloteichus tenebrarius]|uniref:Drug resistance transporter, EmrB/QacA subfamily n=1 Tax=Streptoalloteichus tenebrarius (strain ATCC 17920 / DSM 40477 / JCM 4838 / CBS 697.72 / NBRC 16177 / NCIMB 11028 / NRRL B-12390 / A12253. 1 / ISP 5477) TaxID=1933 RepID=A0ABT1HM97_STRSD|nr:MFS transporter [Streptoalloteichus tenebrarius]MCP2256647.1 drug resistance transporter, EmrB/QacA subfamily [Streptoalloteichus tenebrarius]BFF05001.1 MFS transporter [Streptoalloteichus tenebrarius]